MESGEGRRKETVIDSTPPPAPNPAIKGEDLASFLDKFAQTLVAAITTKSHDRATTNMNQARSAVISVEN